MTDVFSIGTLVAGADHGLIDGIPYHMLEPNGGCDSYPVFQNIHTSHDTQILMSRQKALPSLTITYKYAGIWASEYRQIEHFIDNKKDNLNSFYVIDFSSGDVPTSITSIGGGTAFRISTTDTSLFSEIPNFKSNKVFFSNGYYWKVGIIESGDMTANVSIDARVTTDYGTLTSAQVEASGVQIYPMYECYTSGKNLDSFQTIEYVSNGDNKGFTYDGQVVFTTKYKV